MNLLKNIFEKISFNFGGRKNSCGDDNKGNNNNIGNKIEGNNIGNTTIYNITNYCSEQENNIELSEQALRIYKVFKESNDRFLGITRNEKGIPEISLQPSGEVIENLDLRFVEGNIQELVKYGYLVKYNKDVYERGK